MPDILTIKMYKTKLGNYELDIGLQVTIFFTKTNELSHIDTNAYIAPLLLYDKDILKYLDKHKIPYKIIKGSVFEYLTIQNKYIEVNG